MKNNNKGFTLMEMLIVVAIIAILVAIAIPTFSNSLEKAREAADQANLRAAYAQVMADGMMETTTAPAKTENIEYNYPADKDAAAAKGAEWVATVKSTQKQADWTSGGTVDIGGQSVSAKSGGDTWTITFTPDDGKIEIK